MKVLNRFLEDKSYWVKFDVDPPVKTPLWVDVIAKTSSQAIELATDKI